MKKYLLPLLIFSLCQSASAAVIQITEGTQLKLGSGVNYDTEQVFSQCIEEFSPSDIYAEDSITGEQSSAPGSARALSVKSEVLRTLSEMASYENVSFAGQVQYMAYGGGASYSKESIQTTSSDQIAVGIKASADYGRFYLKNVRLKKEYQDLANKDINQFYKSCGHEFVAGYAVGQGVNIVLKSLDYSTYSYEKIDAHANASAGYGAFSGSVQAAFMSVASSLLNIGSLQVSIVGYGTTELKTTSSIIRTKKDVNEMVKVVTDFISGMSSSNAMKVAYYTQPYPIKDQQYRTAEMEFRHQRLFDMYSAYTKISTDYDRLRTYILTDYQKDLAVLCKYSSGTKSCKEYGDYLKQLATTYESAQAAMVIAIKTCGQAEDISHCQDSHVDEIFKTVTTPIMWPNQYQYILGLAYYKEFLAKHGNQ
jgi:hypothetical protein